MWGASSGERYAVAVHVFQKDKDMTTVPANRRYADRFSPHHHLGNVIGDAMDNPSKDKIVGTPLSGGQSALRRTPAARTQRSSHES